MRRASELVQRNYGLPSEAAVLFMSLARSAGVATDPLLLVPDTCVWQTLQDSMIDSIVLTPNIDRSIPDVADELIWDPRQGRLRYDGNCAGKAVLFADGAPDPVAEDWDQSAASQTEVRGSVTLADDGNYTGTLNLDLTGLFVNSESLRNADSQKSRVTALVTHVSIGYDEGTRFLTFGAIILRAPSGSLLRGNHSSTAACRGCAPH